MTTQDNLSVAAYFTKLKGFWDELSIYSKIPQCTCGAAKEFSAEREEEKAPQFFLGLNNAFHTVRSQILGTEPLPSLNNAYAQDEKQQTLLASRTSTIEPTALHT